MLAAIIQSRMGSSRLPGKTLADLHGKPMLEQLIERVRASRHVQEIVIATTTEPRDDVLVEFARARGLRFSRGSEQDVLDRFYQAAKQFGVDEIVRVTPDCPLMDPDVIDAVVEAHRSGGYEYTSNTVRRTFPDGLDVEVFSFSALERAWREAARASEREHVTPYLRVPDRFRVGSVEGAEDLSSFKWSVDTDRDLAFMRAIYARLSASGRVFRWSEVLNLLKKEPALSAVNQDSTVNEGYYRSLVNDPPVALRARSLRLGAQWQARARRLIPGGSQTLSKGPTQFVQGVAPGFLTRGQGARVWDADGNEYIDYSLALGPIILGYNHPAVNTAVEGQLKNGTAFSLPHPLEVELAEQLAEIIPCAERVRFGKNGSDVTAGAVRLARAVTGRDMIACCGYHGWQDWYIGTTPRNLGVPESVRALTRPFEYNNLESLWKIFRENPGRVAGVILEPMGVIEPRERFLEEVRDLAHREGALLIFDEMLTGFRLALGGAQEYFGVTPDLACFGKAMANGLPLSALVGRREVMDRLEELFFSFTFGGETLSLAAGLATVNVLRAQPVIRHLWAQGKQLQDGFNVLAKHFKIERHARCAGLPPRTVVSFQDEEGRESLDLKSLFQQECCKRGVLFTGSHNMSLGHGEAEIDHTLHVYRDALGILAEALREGSVERRLEGPAVQPVFRHV